MLRPIIGAFVMLPKYVMSQWQCVDVGPGLHKLFLDEAHGLRAKAFIVVKKQDPIMRTAGQGVWPCLLHSRRPRYGQHPIRVTRCDVARIICGGLIDNDHLIGKSQGTQARAKDGRTVVRDDESAQPVCLMMHCVSARTIVTSMSLAARGSLCPCDLPLSALPRAKPTIVSHFLKKSLPPWSAEKPPPKLW